MRKRVAAYVLRQRSEALTARRRTGIIRYIWSKIPKAIVRVIDRRTGEQT